MRLRSAEASENEAASVNEAENGDSEVLKTRRSGGRDGEGHRDDEPTAAGHAVGREAGRVQW